MAKKQKKKNTRGYLSTIDLMPPDLKEKLTEALREKKLTQAEIVHAINKLLEERGANTLSYSAVNRYSNQIFKKASQVLEAQEAAKQLIGKIGDNEGDLSRAVIEIARTLIFDISMKEDLDPEVVTKLALSIQRLELAEKTSIEREEKIRDLVREEQKQKLEEAVNKGLISSEVFEQTQHILGIYNAK